MFGFLKHSNIHDFSMIHRHSSQSPKADGSNTLAVSEQQQRSRSNSPSASPSPSKNTTPAFAVGDEVLVIGTVNTSSISAVITEVVAPASAGRPYRYRVREKGSDRIFSAAYPEAEFPLDESDLVEEGRLVKGSLASFREVVDRSKFV